MVYIEVFVLLTSDELEYYGIFGRDEIPIKNNMNFERLTSSKNEIWHLILVGFVSITIDGTLEIHRFRA